jgi:hypothetical protein
MGAPAALSWRPSSSEPDSISSVNTPDDCGCGGWGECTEVGAMPGRCVCVCVRALVCVGGWGGGVEGESITQEGAMGGARAVR